MKLNLYTNQNKKIYHAKHVDFTNQDTGKPLENTTNTVLNFTDCNGGTIIDNKSYPSKANQALIFSNNLVHQGYAQTDTDKRIMLNVGLNTSSISIRNYLQTLSITDRLFIHRIKQIINTKNIKRQIKYTKLKIK